ncbi:MAG TPA: GTPase RsgA, partial [Jiangellaceae bacterium]|nr:GTPase RsgA [Jiangellaceae bacterium]
KGRHTTSHRELVVLPAGGVVLDTPGLRSVGLVADQDAVATAFPDVEELAEHCRFRDCGHETEPDCAVLDAVAEGDLDERRLASWRKLGREAARPGAPTPGCVPRKLRCGSGGTGQCAATTRSIRVRTVPGCVEVAR